MNLNSGGLNHVMRELEYIVQKNLKMQIWPNSCNSDSSPTQLNNIILAILVW